MSLQGGSSRQPQAGYLSKRRLIMLATVSFLLGVVIWQAPRAKGRDGIPHTSYGPPKAIGAGSARAYLTVQEGLPVELGVELSEDALRNLPAGMKWMPGHEHKMVEHLLDLPEPRNLTPFRFVELNWNPGGHEPPGIYDEPHFDFHFYTITLAERNAIDPVDPGFLRRAENLPRPELIPTGYVSPPPILPFPRMGVHWWSAEAEELNGKPFTKTFIRGSWDGRMIFYEPMITKAFLESKPNVSLPIAGAACYEPAGYHPSNYSIRYDPKQHAYRISLGGFRYRGCGTLESALRPPKN